MQHASDEPVILHQWSARNVRPVVLFYVALVFVVFMVLAFFVVHSPSAVKALAIAAVGSFASLIVNVILRTEYQLTNSGLEKRPRHQKSPQPFKTVFQYDHLSHVVPVKHGFKYYKPLGNVSPLRRFWNAHISDKFSGEVHVEAEDRETVLGIVMQQGIRTGSPDTLVS